MALSNGRARRVQRRIGLGDPDPSMAGKVGNTFGDLISLSPVSHHWLVAHDAQGNPAPEPGQMWDLQSEQWVDEDVAYSGQSRDPNAVSNLSPAQIAAKNQAQLRADAEGQLQGIERAGGVFLDTLQPGTYYSDDFLRGMITSQQWIDDYISRANGGRATNAEAAAGTVPPAARQHQFESMPSTPAPPSPTSPTSSPPVSTSTPIGFPSSPPPSIPEMVSTIHEISATDPFSGVEPADDSLLPVGVDRVQAPSSSSSGMSDTTKEIVVGVAVTVIGGFLTAHFLKKRRR